MMKTLIVLSDGTEIFSGDSRKTAVLSCTLTQSVNSGRDLNPGSVCSAMAELKILGPAHIQAGDALQLYKVEENGTRHAIGIFFCEKPVLVGAVLQVRAYDAVSLLDRDLSRWLDSLTGWPYSLYTLVRMVCSQCGAVLFNREIPNGGYMVKRFSARGVTGRDLLQWAAQAAGRFVRARRDGGLEFAWYTPAETEVGCGENRVPYFMGSFTREDYQVAPIEKVQIQFSGKDVGTVWPDTDRDCNTYRITGNYLLSPDSPQELLGIAKALYHQLSEVQYTPCRVTVPYQTDIQPGTILKIYTPDGQTVHTYVMQKKSSGDKSELESRGNPRRDMSTAVNNRKFEAMEGKLLELATDVNGIHVNVEHMKQEVQDLEEFSRIATKDMGNLQTELDGKVETFFGLRQPGPDNIPASGWSDEERKTHLGDLYYITGTGPGAGKVYRWAESGGRYAWECLEDKDISRALAEAAAAQDTADGKRRVFTEIPAPPYDMGDLWTQGTGGELKRCRISRTDGIFHEADWEPATNSGENFTQQQKLISALEVRAGTIESSVSNLGTQTATRFEQTDTSIAAKVSQKGSGQSFGWTLEQDSWTLHSGNRQVFRADGDGAFIQGVVQATTGKIGQWELAEWGLHSGGTGGKKIVALQAASTDSAWAFAAGGDNLQDFSAYPFRVGHDGVVVATKAEITGRITADTGRVGGWSLENWGLHSGGGMTGKKVVALQAAENGEWAIAAGGTSLTDFNRSPFRVSHDGTVYAAKAHIEGEVKAESGLMGGWELADWGLHSGGGNTGKKVVALQSAANDRDWAIAVGGDDLTAFGNFPFRVNYDGGVYAANAHITGEVTAESGSIGEFTLKDGYLSTNGATWEDASQGIYIGPSGFSVKEKFTVYADTGNLIARNADITGTITADSGKIGGWELAYWGLRSVGSNLMTAIQDAGLNGWTFVSGAADENSFSSAPFRVHSNGNLYAENGYFHGSVRANKIAYGGADGTFSGRGLSSNTVTTAETSGGINTSLGYADYANSVFSGVATAVIFGTNSLSVATNFSFRNYRVAWKQIGSTWYLTREGT